MALLKLNTALNCFLFTFHAPLLIYERLRGFQSSKTINVRILALGFDS